MADYHKSRNFALQRECKVKFANGAWFPVKSKMEDLDKKNFKQITYSEDRDLYERGRPTERAPSAGSEEGSKGNDFEMIGEEFYEVQENEITLDDDDDDVFSQQPEFEHVNATDYSTREEVFANGEPGLTFETKIEFLQDENNNMTSLPKPELASKQHEVNLSSKEETTEQDMEKSTSCKKEARLTSGNTKSSAPKIVMAEISPNSRDGLENFINEHSADDICSWRGTDSWIQAPSRPKIPSSFPEKVKYIEDGIRWIKCELQEMKKVDRNINSNLVSLMTSIKQFKKVNETFNEQQEILEDLEDIFEKEQFENSHLIDVPSQSREDGRLGLKRKVSNLERYTRLGRDGRRASYY